MDDKDLFTSVSLPPVSFESNLDPVKEIKDSECQTSDVPSSSQGQQTAVTAVAEVQTDAPPKPARAPVYDEAKLASFLATICPAVMTELDKAAKTKAFTNYKMARDESHDVTRELHTLRSPSQPNIPGLRVSCIDWSCAGSMVAVGFQSASHSDWCVHESAVHFFNVSQFKFDGTKPSRVVETESCVSALAMHPYEPAVVAVGTQTGQILVWSLLDDGYDTVLDNKVHHKDKVTKVAWCQISSRLLLVSSSLDGTMHTYKVTMQTRAVSLCDRYLMSENRVINPGVTCFAFSNEPGVFVAALEGGELYYCSTLSPQRDSRPESPTILKKPIVKKIGREEGPVSCISFSPYVEHLFVAVHLDDKITLWSLKNSDPILVMYANVDLIGGCWSGAQANVFIAWGAGPKAFVFNSDSGRKMAEMGPEPPSLSHILCASLNPKSPKLLAVGTDQGTAYVWETPQYFRLPTE